MPINFGYSPVSEGSGRGSLQSETAQSHEPRPIWKDEADALCRITRERFDRRIAKQRQEISYLQQRVFSDSMSDMLQETSTLTPLANGLRIMEDQVRYLRPFDPKDRAYREKVRTEFAQLVKRFAPSGLPLRFHGTAIYNAERIIADGEISSSVERLGIETSFDTAGQISVTTPSNCELTMRDYAGLREAQGQIPAGCVFVLLPKSAEEEASGQSNLMSSVDFRESPDQLLRVLASPEMLSTVREWLVQAGLDTSKAMEYFAFTDELKSMSNRVNVSTFH